MALEVASASGMDVEAARVTVEGPADAWFVTVEAAIDDVPAAGWSTAWRSAPRAWSCTAAGLVAAAEELGTYPLIDTRAAVDRLNAAGSGTAGPTGAMATDEPEPEGRLRPA